MMKSDEAHKGTPIFEIKVGRPHITRLYRKGFGPQDRSYYDIDFVQGVNLIIGPCGSGKTRLLKDIKLYYEDLSKNPKRNGAWSSIQGTFDDGFVLGGGFRSDLWPVLKPISFIDLGPLNKSLSDPPIGELYLSQLEDCISEIGPEDLIIIDDFSRYLTSVMAGNAIKRISSKRCQAILSCNKIDFIIPDNAQIIKLKGISDGIVVESVEHIARDNGKYKERGVEYQR